MNIYPTISDLQEVQTRPTSLDVDPVKVFSTMLNRGGLQEQHRFVAKMVLEEHNTLQQTMMRNVIVPWILGMAEAGDRGYFDLRNEGTVKLCMKIRDLIGEPTGMPFV